MISVGGRRKEERGELKLFIFNRDPTFASFSVKIALDVLDFGIIMLMLA